MSSPDAEPLPPTFSTLDWLLGTFERAERRAALRAEADGSAGVAQDADALADLIAVHRAFVKSLAGDSPPRAS